MATGDDTLTWVRPKSTLLAPVKPVAARGQEAAGEAVGVAAEESAARIDPLPRPGNDYVAHARHASRPQMALFLVDKDGLPDSFAYSDLRRCRMVAAKEPGKGPTLLMQFNDAEVEIEGRKLHSLCHLIGIHLMPWVWEHPAPGNFKDQEATLIRKITITIKGAE